MQLWLTEMSPTVVHPIKAVKCRQIHESYFQVNSCIYLLNNWINSVRSFLQFELLRCSSDRYQNISAVQEIQFVIVPKLTARGNSLAFTVLEKEIADSFQAVEEVAVIIWCIFK